MGKRGLTKKTSALCFKDLNDFNDPKDFKVFKVVRVLRGALPETAAPTPALYPLRKLSAAQPSR